MGSTNPWLCGKKKKSKYKWTHAVQTMFFKGQLSIYIYSCCLVDKLYLTLFDPMDYNLPGSSVHGIFQARMLEWVVISFFIYICIYIYTHTHIYAMIYSVSFAITQRTDLEWVLSYLESGYFAVKNENLSVVSHILQPHWLWPARFLCPWNSPGKNTGVGSCSLLQGIFQTQGSDPGLQHCRWILYCLSQQGSPRILEWVAYLFSRGTSWPRNWTWSLAFQVVHTHVHIQTMKILNSVLPF